MTSRPNESRSTNSDVVRRRRRRQKQICGSPTLLEGPARRDTQPEKSCWMDRNEAIGETNYCTGAISKWDRRETKNRSASRRYLEQWPRVSDCLLAVAARMDLSTSCRPRRGSFHLADTTALSSPDPPADSAWFWLVMLRRLKPLKFRRFCHLL